MGRSHGGVTLKLLQINFLQDVAFFIHSWIKKKIKKSFSSPKIYCARGYGGETSLKQFQDASLFSCESFNSFAKDINLQDKEVVAKFLDFEFVENSFFDLLALQTPWNFFQLLAA